MAVPPLRAHLGQAATECEWRLELKRRFPSPRAVRGVTWGCRLLPRVPDGTGLSGELLPVRELYTAGFMVSTRFLGDEKEVSVFGLFPFSPLITVYQTYCFLTKEKLLFSKLGCLVFVSLTHEPLWLGLQTVFLHHSRE